MSARPVDSSRRGGTRAQLLAAARAELIEGNGDLEVARVAKRAGVSAGLTYYHFKNKSGLLNALVRAFYDTLDDTVTAVPFQGATWAVREQARVYAMVAFFYRDPVALLVATRLRTDPTFAADESDRQLRLNQLGASNIRQAQRDGEIDGDLDPLLLVSMLLAGVMAGVQNALGQDLPLESAQREIWSFVARAAGVAA
ncbi:MAG: TetR/AcrR family transcriptional regulator [Pseudomonadota bacterium]